jgi:hypothetical protein
MAPILAQVGGDAVRSDGLAGQGGLDRVGLAAPASAIPRLAERSHVIDVHTQL